MNRYSLVMVDQFPRRLTEVTPQWLSDVLNESVVSFTATDIGAGKGMMGDIFLLRVELEQKETRLAVAKFSAEREDLRLAAKRAGIFEREVNFYGLIAPMLHCRIPATFGSWYDGDAAEFLILMEHIDADPSVNQIEGVSLSQAKMVMRELAALHVPESEVADYRSLFNFVNAPGRRANQANFVMSGWAKVRELVPVELRVGNTPEQMVEKLNLAFDDLGSLPMFLLHGDTRPDNLLFMRDASGVALIDWQGLTLGPREWDIGYFLAQGLRVEDRRAWTNELLDEYISHASDSSDVFNKNEMLRKIGKVGWFSFGVACSLFTIADTSREETIALCRSMAERSLSLLYDAGELP